MRHSFSITAFVRDRRGRACLLTALHTNTTPTATLQQGLLAYDPESNQVFRVGQLSTNVRDVTCDATLLVIEPVPLPAVPFAFNPESMWTAQSFIHLKTALGIFAQLIHLGNANDGAYLAAGLAMARAPYLALADDPLWPAHIRNAMNEFKRASLPLFSSLNPPVAEYRASLQQFKTTIAQSSFSTSLFAKVRGHRVRLEWTRLSSATLAKDDFFEIVVNCFVLAFPNTDPIIGGDSGGPVYYLDAVLGVIRAASASTVIVTPIYLAQERLGFT